MSAPNVNLDENLEDSLEVKDSKSEGSEAPTDDKVELDDSAKPPEVDKAAEREKFYLETYREQQRIVDRERQKAEELQKRIEALEKPPVREASSDEFFQNPAVHTRKLIKEELESTVAPLIEQFRNMQKTDAYSQLKAKFKANPTFANAFANPEIENYIDQAMRSNEPTDANMQATIFAVMGAHSMGMFGAPTNNPTPAPTMTSSKPTPPNVKPSPPAPPVRTNDPKVRPLDEHEKRICKEHFGGNAAEYLKWKDMDPRDVVGDVKD